MALRTGHGAGRGTPRIEVLPVDELPAGVPADARPAPDRNPSGTFRASPGTTALAREGAKAAAESRQLAQLLGLRKVPADHPFAPYVVFAKEWRDAYTAQLISDVGGGVISAGAAAVIANAAMQLACSRWLLDRGSETGNSKDLVEASRLADASRQNILAAWELAAKGANARPDTHLLPWERPEYLAKKALEAKAAEESKDN